MEKKILECYYFNDRARLRHRKQYFYFLLFKLNYSRVSVHKYKTYLPLQDS